MFQIGRDSCWLQLVWDGVLLVCFPVLPLLLFLFLLGRAALWIVVREECFIWSGNSPFCSCCDRLLGCLFAKFSHFFHHVLFTFGGEQVCFFSCFHAGENELLLQIKGHWAK